MVLSRTPKISVRIAGVFPHSPAHARRKRNPEIGDQLDCPVKIRNGEVACVLSSVFRSDASHA